MKKVEVWKWGSEGEWRRHRGTGSKQSHCCAKGPVCSIWNWSNHILRTEKWDWSNMAVFGTVSITICHLCTQINGYYWLTTISTWGVALVLCSTPDAPAEEVEACGDSHAGCADTEGQLHSLVIASISFPILHHDISMHRLHELKDYRCFSMPAAAFHILRSTKENFSGQAGEQNLWIPAHGCL